MTLLSGLFITFILITTRVCAFYVPDIYQKQQLKTALRGDFFDDVSGEKGETSGARSPPPLNADQKGTPDEELLSLEDLDATIPEWDKHVPKFVSVHLVGRLGSDPNPRYFDDGKVVLNLSLAVRRKYTSIERKQDNIQEDATDWYSLEMWGKDAEYASKYANKGCRVGVRGPITVDTWNDKATGEKRQKAKIIVRDFDILETKAESELRRGRQSANQSYGNKSYSNNNNQKSDNNRRSFYTDDEDDEDDDDEDGGFPSAGTGGFF